MSQKMSAAELLQANETLLKIISKLEQERKEEMKKNYFGTFMLLVNLAETKGLAIKRKSNTQLAREYIDFAYTDYTAVLDGLLTNVDEQKDFNRFVECFELVSFKNDKGKPIMVSTGEKQTRGCRIKTEKYKSALIMCMPAAVEGMADNE